MLDDPRSQRFIEHFLDRWLSLREIDATSPDTKLYPSSALPARLHGRRDPRLLP